MSTRRLGRILVVRLLAAVVAPALASAALAQSSGMGTDFVAFNRYAPTGFAGQGTLIAAPGDQISNGQIHMRPYGPGPTDHTRASYRFTFDASSSPRTAQSVWLYVDRAGSPAATLQYRVAVEPDAGDGTPASSSSFATFTVPSSRGWFNVGVPAVAMIAGSVYHVVVEHVGGATNDDFLILHTSRSRHPHTYMPHHPTSAPHQSPYDPAFGALVYSACGQYLIKQGENKGYSPVFLVEHVDGAASDPQLFGNPYDLHHDLGLGGGQVYGERLEPTSDILDVRYAALLSGEFTGDQVQARPCGDLFVEIYEQDAGGSTATRIARALLIEGACGGHPEPWAGTYGSGRWHWFGAVLDQEIDLLASHVYFIVLAAPDSQKFAQRGVGQCNCTTTVGPGVTWDKWNLPVNGSSLLSYSTAFPTTPDQLPTFGRTSSRVIGAVRDTAATSHLSNIASYGTNADNTDTFDAGFILGRSSASGRPMAFNDELGGDSCGSDDLRVANPGATVHVFPVARSACNPTVNGELAVRVVQVPSGFADCRTLRASPVGSEDVQLQFATCTGALLPCYPEPPPSSQIICPPIDLEFVMPSAPYVRYEVQFGRLVPPGNTFVADETVPYEIRTPVTTCTGCQ